MSLREKIAESIFAKTGGIDVDGSGLLADAIIAALPECITPLEWDVDGRKLSLDDTMQMGLGYDWDGFEIMRQEAYGLGCGYIIWPDHIASKTFNLYGTHDGMYNQDLDGEDAAKAAAEAHYRSLIMSAFGGEVKT